jgi:hypothetical protein
LTVFKRNSVPPITGCWLLPEIQFTGTLPMLHEYVPSESASYAPDGP